MSWGEGETEEDGVGGEGDGVDETGVLSTDSY
jgi:hypothetical protein